MIEYHLLGHQRQDESEGSNDKRLGERIIYGKFNL